jgi:Icc protein
LDGTESLSTTKPALRSPWAKAAALSVVLLALLASARAPEPAEFHFALLGDRTGEAQPGVYPEAWREAVADNPAFVLTVGDSIQGGNDQTLTAEWASLLRIIAPYRRFQLFLTPGNHDVWDTASQLAYKKFAHHPLHYSFDWRQAHFTILDDSQSDDLKPEEMAFLAQDLAAHAAQPVKFIVSHRPSWLFHVVLGDSKFPLHQLALKYGVKYVIAGHIHQMLHFELDGVTYLSMASSGGHLRNDKEYRHGWFFQHTRVDVGGATASFKIEELGAPFGQGRITAARDWGAAGLRNE